MCFTFHCGDEVIIGTRNFDMNWHRKLFGVTPSVRPLLQPQLRKKRVPDCSAEDGRKPNLNKAFFPKNILMHLIYESCAYRKLITFNMGIGILN